MKTITVQHGVGNQVTLQFESQATFTDILSDPRVQAALGYGASVEPTVQGVVQNGATVAPEGVVIKVHNKSCDKAGM